MALPWFFYFKTSIVQGSASFITNLFAEINCEFSIVAEDLGM